MSPLLIETKYRLVAVVVFMEVRAAVVYLYCVVAKISYVI